MEENGVSCGRLSLAHTDSRTCTHTRPRVAILCVMCWIFSSYRCGHLLFVPSASVWSLSLRALHYIGDGRYERLAVSVSLEPAREVACKDCTAPTFFLCVRCFHFRHFDRASLIWRRSRTDVPRIGRCDYPVIAELVLRIVIVFIFAFSENMAVIKC